MKKRLTAQGLPNDIDALKALVLQKDQHIDTLSDEVSRLSELVIFFKVRQFYKSSEKHPDQAELFNEPEVEEAQAVEETAPQSLDGSLSKKSKAGRKPLPKSLPREQLEIIPAKVIVRQLVRKKYVCPCCEGALKLAPMPNQPIPKSIAGPGLLAYITTAKYQDALPLYRQENAFKRLGVALSRQTMANWMVKTAELCQPLYNLLQDHLLESGICQDTCRLE